MMMYSPYKWEVTDSVAFRRGREAAIDEIARGKLRLYWQVRSSWGDLMTDLLRQRFGVSIAPSSCLTTVAETAFEHGHNSAILEHITVMFGAEAFQKLLDEIDAKRKADYDEYFEPG